MAEPASSFATPPTALSAQLLQLWAERNLPVLYWAAQQALRLHEDTVRAPSRVPELTQRRRR